MEPKRVTIISPEEQAIRALANDENGAEYGVLVELAKLLLNGMEIDPDFQKVANAIVVQSLLMDRLPPKKKGRPKDDDGIDGFSVTRHYFDLRDNGVRYADAVAEVAAVFHKDERHIMRLVRENKHSIGNTKEDRDRNRKWWRICAEMRDAVIAKGGEPADMQMGNIYKEMVTRQANRDPMRELDEMIDEVLSRWVPTDTK